MEIAAKPLLEKEIITKNYMERMILLHDIEKPYIIYGSDIAVPHATPEDGVKKVGMSLLKVEQGIKLSSTQKIRLVLVLAPIDKNVHLRALMQVLQLSESAEAIERIIKANTEDQIFKCIKSLLEVNQKLLEQ